MTNEVNTAPSSAAADGKGLAFVPGLIAVVGCDGSGKTRLAKDLTAFLKKKRVTERQYMGLVSGETGDKIKQLPVIGVMLESYLARKVRHAQDMKKKVPGVLTAGVMYLFSQWRASQLKKVIKQAQAGVLVLAERFPQAEMAGFHYDGPGLAVERGQSDMVRKLAQREQELYEEMAQLRPAVVIRLTIDADTAHARKPDHPLDELQDKSEALLRITYNGARIVEIDATQDYDVVFAKALQAIEEAAPQV